ncbi:unnamed protein product [Cuscuta campestris]|uniref:Uncharacterized protein n=1 Tax=Cuscuta campestris TaxID=132261 RepID=A0A484K6H6_9ASTE|nr:unnamed protein product [Cuscuta campestris]
MMMSKKMKRVSEESSSYGGSEDAKTRMKHQALFQDFQELEKETNGFREKLEDFKKRKLILQAEVRFLRRRRSYLLQVKSMDSPEENKLETHLKTGPKSTRPNKKDTGPCKLPAPRPKPTPGVVTGRKETTPPSAKQHKWQKNSSGGKEPVLAGSSSAPESIDLNHNDRLLYGGNSAGPRVPLFDLNKESSLSWKDVSPPSRVPFDLNEISTEEEPQPRWNFEPASVAEESARSLMRGGGGNEEQQGGDLRISLCRNAAGGEGTSRARKPKISWQDPVALRV